MIKYEQSEIPESKIPRGKQPRNFQDRSKYPVHQGARERQRRQRQILEGQLEAPGELRNAIGEKFVGEFVEWCNEHLYSTDPMAIEVPQASENQENG